MKKTRYNLLILLALLINLLVVNSALAIKPIYSGGKERAAIRGYDPVAYFTENAPVKGSSEFSTEHLGATWFFASEANKQLFINNPEKYTPQYGGYCAYAVSRNSSASIKPEFFTIENDKLYLNYSNSVYKKWVKDKKKYIKDADKNWPAVLAK